MRVVGPWLNRRGFPSGLVARRERGAVRSCGGAHLSFLQAVAAGILPAVEGGILAARNERGSGRAT